VQQFTSSLAYARLPEHTKPLKLIVEEGHEVGLGDTGEGLGSQTVIEGIIAK
jgi:hypothetical protein